MKNNESTDSFSSFRLLIAVGWALMVLRVTKIIATPWGLILGYWGFLIVLYVALWLLVGIIAGIVAMVQNHKE